MAFPFGNRARWCWGAATALGAQRPGEAPHSSQEMPAFLQQELVTSKFLAAQAEPSPMPISLAKAWEAKSFWDKEEKMPVHDPGGFVQQKEEAIGTRSASIHTAERLTAASPNNFPNSLSCQDPRGRWLEAWARGHSIAPARGWGRGCMPREFLGQVSGAGRTAVRCRLQMAGGCSGGSPDGCAAGARLPGVTCPAMHPSNPDLPELPAALATGGINMPQNQGLGRFFFSPQPSPTLPRHPRRRLAGQHRGPGQVAARVPCQARWGCVSVLKDVAVPAPATGTVCAHHAERAESVRHGTPKPPHGNGGKRKERGLRRSQAGGRGCMHGRARSPTRSVVGKAPWGWGKGVLGGSLQGAVCMLSPWPGFQHSALSPW